MFVYKSNFKDLFARWIGNYCQTRLVRPPDTSTIQDVPVRKILTLAALHPQFKVQPASQVPTNSKYFYSSTQVGTQSIVSLSGLELTVKYTRTPFRFFSLYLLFTLYKNSVRTMPVQPQLSSWISRGFPFIILIVLVPIEPYMGPANRHVVMASKCK